MVEMFLNEIFGWGLKKCCVKFYTKLPGFGGGSEVVLRSMKSALCLVKISCDPKETICSSEIILWIVCQVLIYKTMVK